MPNDAMTTAQTVISLSPVDLEALIRRVVREELSALLPAPSPDILNDWSQEGPDDPEGDEELLAEALVELEKYENDPNAWISWEDFKAELNRAEAAGELPD